MNPEKTSKALQEKGYEVTLVKTASEALEKIKQIIPQGASITNGSSKTLEQIGYFDYLKSGKHKWIDLKGKAAEENDKEKRTKLRRDASLADFYLGSVNALTSEGEFVFGSNTGSQMPSIVFNSPNLIFIVSTKKIVANLDEAMKRLVDFVVPLEDKQSREKYGESTALNKIVIFNGEAVGNDRKIYFILVDEDLGF